jgi:nucleoside-diphosphate-sugar epimerase
MKKTIISGATGFLGFHLSAALIKQGIDVFALTRRGTANAARLPKGVTVIPCDMDEYEKLPELLNGTQPDIFYHLAWEGATGPGRADAELQTLNVQRTLSALIAAKASGCKKFIAAGTVYENFYEQMVSAPVFRNASFYIMAKRFARDMARQLALKAGIDFVWCTFCHPVGRYMKPEQLFAYAVKSLMEGNSPAFGPAEDFFDVIDAEDLAYGLYLAGEKNVSQSEYFIGSGEARPLKEYLAALPQILGVNTDVRIGQKPDDGMRFDPRWFDGEKFEKDTGFKAKVSFEEAIRRLKENGMNL